MTSMKNPQKDLSLVSQIDWARLAAYIDGEGGVHILTTSHTSPTHQGRPKNEFVRVAITNSDMRLALWLQDTFGGAVQVRTLQNPAHKPIYVWTVSCAYAVAVLQRCLPYFITKREQAELCIALQATMKRWGVKGVPESVIKERFVIREKIHVLNKKGVA